MKINASYTVLPASHAPLLTLSNCPTKLLTLKQSSRSWLLWLEMQNLSAVCLFSQHRAPTTNVNNIHPDTLFTTGALHKYVRFFQAETNTTILGHSQPVTGNLDMIKIICGQSSISRRLATARRSTSAWSEHKVYDMIMAEFAVRVPQSLHSLWSVSCFLWEVEILQL